MLSEISKYTLECLEMAKSWGDTILSKGIDSIVNVKATKSDHPIGTTKEGAISGHIRWRTEISSIKFSMVVGVKWYTNWFESGITHPFKVGNTILDIVRR